MSRADRELLRRLIHIGLGAGAYLVPVLGWAVLAGLGGLAAIVNALLIPRWRPLRFLLREEGSGGIAGLVLYPVAVTSLLLVFQDDHVPAQVAWLALALGDGLAPILGRHFDRPAWPWRRDKSVSASTLAFLCAMIAMLPVTEWRIALLASAFGLVGEAAPLPVNDNVSVAALAAGGAVLALRWS